MNDTNDSPSPDDGAKTRRRGRPSKSAAAALAAVRADADTPATAPRPLDVTKMALDGRRLRSQRSRRQIVLATLDLIREGNYSPSADAVAERAEVGLRSVFRHFNDMDSLFREISDIVVEEISAYFQEPFKSAEWQGRVLEMAARRAKAYEAIMAIKIAADLKRHRSAVLAEDHIFFNDLLRKRLHDTMPPKVRRNRVMLDALDMMLSFDVWRRLRMDQKLTPLQARRTVEASLCAVMDTMG